MRRLGTTHKGKKFVIISLRNRDCDVTLHGNVLYIYCDVNRTK